MAEMLVSFCDYCNPRMSINLPDWQGFIAHSEEGAIGGFGWTRTADGRIMCTECQDEMIAIESGGRAKTDEK